MSTTTFSVPTQYSTKTIKIDGEDVVGLFFSLEIYENIYSPIITGTIGIIDSDGAGFIEKEEIEFIEDLEIEFENASGDTLEFKGKLNGLKAICELEIGSQESGEVLRSSVITHEQDFDRSTFNGT